MILTTTVTFVPSQAPHTPTPVLTPPGPRGAFTRAMDLAMSAASPNGTYVVHVETDVPSPASIDVPIPSVTRLMTREHALADLKTLVQPDDPRLFHPLTTFCPRMLQIVRAVVVKAIEETPL